MVPDVNIPRISERRNQIIRIAGLVGIQSVATALATIFIRIVVVNNTSVFELKFYPTFMVMLTLASVASFSVQEKVVQTRVGPSEGAVYSKRVLWKSGDRIVWLLLLSFWIVLAVYQDTMMSTMGLIAISLSLLVTNYLFAFAQGLSLRDSDFRAYTGFPVLVVVMQGASAVLLLRIFHLSLFWFILAATLTPVVVYMVRSRWNPDLRNVSVLVFLSDTRLWKSACSLLLIWLLAQWDQIYIPNCSVDWLAQDYVRFSTFSRIPLFIAAAVAPYVLKLNPAKSVAGVKETSVFFLCLGFVLFGTSVVLVLSHEIWFSLMFGRSVGIDLTDLFVLGLIHPLAGIALILSFRDLNSGVTVLILATANVLLGAWVTVGCGRFSGGSVLIDAAIVGGPLFLVAGLQAGRYVYGNRMIGGMERAGCGSRE